MYTPRSRVRVTSHYCNRMCMHVVCGTTLQLIKWNVKKFLFFSRYTTMSNNSNEWINWIEEAISKQHIKYYDYKHFHSFKEIGTGSFGKVYRVNWKNSQTPLALKSFFHYDNATLKEIVHEVSDYRTS